MNFDSPRISMVLILLTAVDDVALLLSIKVFVVKRAHNGFIYYLFLK